MLLVTKSEKKKYVLKLKWAFNALDDVEGKQVYRRIVKALSDANIEHPAHSTLNQQGSSENIL